MNYISHVIRPVTKTLCVSDLTFRSMHEIDIRMWNDLSFNDLAGDDNSFFYLSRTPESISPNYFLRGKLRAGGMENGVKSMFRH